MVPQVYWVYAIFHVIVFKQYSCLLTLRDIRIYCLYPIILRYRPMILKTLKDFGAAIREARKAKGMTQAALAVRLGTTQDWISQLETGRLDNPGLGTVLRLAAVIDLDFHTAEEPQLASQQDFDTGDLATDEPSFVKGPAR